MELRRNARTGYNVRQIKHLTSQPLILLTECKASDDQSTTNLG